MISGGIPALPTVLFHSNLNSLRRKYLSDARKHKIVLSSGATISKRPLKRGHWWLKNKKRKFQFRFVESRFLVAINCTGSTEGALVPVLLRITQWPKSGLPVSSPGLFPCWSVPAAVSQTRQCTSSRSDDIWWSRPHSRTGKWSGHRWYKGTFYW